MANFAIRSVQLPGLFSAFQQLQQSNALLAERKAQARAERERKRGNAFRTVGSVAGAVVGAYVSGGTGTAAGAATGASIGSALGGVVSGTGTSQEVVNAGISAASFQERQQASQRSEETFAMQKQSFQMSQQERQARLEQQQQARTQQQATRSAQEANNQRIATQIEQNLTGGTENFNQLPIAEQRRISSQIQTVRQIADAQNVDPQVKQQQLLRSAPPSYETSELEIGGKTFTVATNQYTGDQKLIEDKPNQRAYVNPRDTTFTPTYVRPGSNQEKQLQGAGYVTLDDFKDIAQIRGIQERGRERGAARPSVTERTVPTLSSIKTAARRSVQADTGLKTVNKQRLLARSIEILEDNKTTATPEQSRLIDKQIASVQREQEEFAFRTDFKSIEGLIKTDVAKARERFEELRGDLSETGSAAGIRNVEEKIADLAARISKKERQVLKEQTPTEEELERQRIQRLRTRALQAGPNVPFRG